ncbi:MAG TPA: LAGLIDADG family homing endonuclease, partial [Chloroflexota bacterium]
FYRAGLTDGLYAIGEDVRRVAAQRVLAKVTRPDLWAESRVALDGDSWHDLVGRRQKAGLTQNEVAATIGVRQPITISHWERGINRPIESQFAAYLRALGLDATVPYTRVPSKITECLNHDDSSRNARWRKVSRRKPLADFTLNEVAELGDDVRLAPRAHDHKSFGRYLPITRDLAWFLGWYVAEGTLSRHQVSLNVGDKDERFIAELSAAIHATFGETLRRYHARQSGGIKLYFHSALAARLLRAWRLGGPAHEKRVPDLLFSLPEALQLAFLEGYFLGDGTTAGVNVSFVTNSPALKDGLLYLLAQLGYLATTSHSLPSTRPEAPIQTRHPYDTITICGKEQLARCRPLWHRHANAPRVEDYLAKPGRKPLDFVPISDDLVGLKVVSAEEIAPVGEYVYDFSVEGDENFICGTGGLACHNTDADVDGSHIRTLLLTFFFRFMEPLIAHGYLYIAQPPLYRVAAGKEAFWVYNDRERDEAIKKLKGKTVNVQRYKGLGEMNPAQLWETTMDPSKRTILQVSVEDAVQADEVFEMLMGDEVPPRKRFIQSHAKEVRNLDV